MKLKNTLLVLMLLTSLTLSARTKQDVIHLKNGEVVKGKIVAQEFNTLVQIRTADGNVLTFQMDEVEMINTEGEVKDASVGVRNWWKRGAIEMIAGSEYSLSPFSMRKDRRVLREVQAATVDLAEITIPDSVTVIGDEAFRLCPKLTKVTIPNSVKVIGERAFICCQQLTDIIIPESVTTIGYGTFSYCTGLTSIYSLNPEPPTCGDLVFYIVDKSACTLYVPKGARSAYSSAAVWNSFTNIVEME